MNKHIALDKLSVKAGGLYGDRMLFFREGVDSAPIGDISSQLEMDFKPPGGTGEYNIPVRYGSLEATARYSLLNWAGKGKPGLIYHHGSGETNYTARLKKVLPSAIRSEINLIALSIPWNRSMKEYLYAIGSLERFSFLLASSVRLLEAAGGWLRIQNSGKIVASGISLGGWVTNLHCAIYGSMDEYRPIFAGAALDHLFTDTVYKNLIASEFRERRGEIKKTLNFEDHFHSADKARVFPLLGRYDQYIDYERQKSAYMDEQLKTLDKGHITGTMDVKYLRDHLSDGVGILN